MAEAGFERDILEALRSLPQDKKREAADFIDYLRSKPFPGVRRRVRGLWRQFPIDITSEDISEVRQEMWSAFPRELE